ncbi:MAG: hypothetical protein RSB59_04935 [Clostridia bacterium]
MGAGCPPLYGNKKSNFYQNKIDKANKIIAEQEAIIALCEKEIAKNEKKD